ncbi:MAG: helix-hairpin-helix domain-containing protein [Gammaproteobacteria bacterium]
MFYLRLYLLIVSLFCASLPALAEPLDINSANPEQLTERMVGIGPSKAIAIVEYRGTHGPFKTIDDLVKVKGVSTRTVEKNRNRIVARPVKTKR